MKDFKKKFSLLLMILLTAASSFALTGLLSERKSLKYFRTQYFDIVFPECSEEFATHVAKNADRIYEEICSEYGIEPEYHLPVTITPDMEMFNAYANSRFRKHIVLFDTMMPYVGVVDEDMMLSVFKHELTHVVTSNMTKKHMKLVQRFFGDHVTLGFFKLSSTLNEGGSVASESRGGYGRLSDGFFLHQVRQLKLQGEFPNWESAMGNYDKLFYNGINYSLGGPFVEYLQKTYGMEKYVDFNYSLINDVSIYVNSSAKKAYGKSMKVLWNEFYDSVKVYDIPANPLEENFVYDFFSADKDSVVFDIKNLRGSSYADLWLADNTLFYCDRGDVYCSKINPDGTFVKSRKLISLDLLSKASASSDGRYLALELYDINHMAYKKDLWIYDVECDKIFKTGISGIADPVILDRNGRKVLAVIKYENQKVFMNYYNLSLDNKGSIASLELSESVSVAENTVLYDLVPFGSCNQKVAAVCIDNTDGIRWSVRVYDGKDFVKYPLPDDFRIQNLKYNAWNNSLSFSYVKKENLPRLAYISLDDNTLYAMEKDVSGGVYEPVLVNGRAIYLGHFVTNSKLLGMDLPKVNFISQGIAVSDGVQEPRKEFIGDGSLEARKFAVYKNSIFIPFMGNCGVYDFDGTRKDDSLLLGGTMIFFDTWDSSFHFLSVGWNPLGNYGEASYSFVVSPNQFGMPFSFDDDVSVVFDTEGFKQASNSFSVSNLYKFGNRCSIYFTEKNDAFYGRRADIGTNEYGLAVADFRKDATNYYFERNKISLGLATAHTQFDFSYINTICGSHGACAEGNMMNVSAGSPMDFTFSHSFSPSFSFLVPRLIPVDSLQGFRYNLPLQAGFSLTPNDYQLATVDARLRLFEMDVQKGVPGILPLYVYRFSFDFGYNGYLYHRNRNFAFASAIFDWGDLTFRDYSDTYSLLLNVELGTYAGFGANSSVNMNLYAGVIYTDKPEDLNKEPDEDHKFNVTFGLSVPLM